MLAWLAAGSAAALDNSDIEKLMQDGNYAAAYELAEARVAEGSGEPDFDFLLGLAALESGHAGQAVFALERVLIAEPQNHRARLELGRAYFLQNDYPSARAEFSTVLAANPPENVRARITQFLDEIARREATQQTRTRAYAEVKTGADSNINSATSNTTVEVPGLGPVTLNETSRAQADNFLSYGFGVSVDHALSKTRGLFAAFRAEQRNNFSSDASDTRVLDFRGGAAFAHGQDKFRIPVQLQQFDVNDQAFRRLVSVNPEWTRSFGSADLGTLFLQLGRLSFPGQDTRNARLALLGGAWTHRVSKPNLTLTLGGYYGDERAERSAGNFNGRDYYGARFGAQWAMTPTHNLYASLALQKVKHDAPHPSFGQVRKDHLRQLTAGWRWQPARAWGLNTEVTYLDNRSNISLFAFDRTQLQLSARYDFY